MFWHQHLDVSPFLGLALVPITLLILWSVVIKGFALWHAARNGQSYWFVALLIFNTLGILEIIYLLFFRTDRTMFLGTPKPVPEEKKQVAESSAAVSEEA